MIRKEQGFTLVELMITMVIFVFVIAAASQVFTGLLTQFKQQSKIAETNIEGIVGLEIMRRDIEHAGYGLPWVWTHAAASNEAIENANTAQSELSYNVINADEAPKALVSGNGDGDGVGGVINDTDVLVVKAVNVATNAAASKWTHLFIGNTVTEWTPATENFLANDRVIVLNPTTRTLIISSGGSFTTRYNTATTPDSIVEPVANDFAPTDSTEVRVVYGVTPAASPVTAALRMPFNRADYYVRTPTAANSMPSRCATGTGILYKATVSQSDGSLTELPLLDCVADMQVVYALDNDEDGDFELGGSSTDAYSDDISALTAEQVRNRVREVDVYILAHEGQRDPSFTFNNWTGSSTCATCIRVGQSSALGRDLDISAVTNYLNYRWKVYTLAVRPTNLR